jgi:TRAP-type C4-dicarboxylate transport system substrate-binding protein
MDIKFGSFSGEAGDHWEIQLRLIEYVEGATGGRLTFTQLPGDTVAPNKEHLTAVAAGLFDIAYMYQGYYYEDVPVFSVFSRPIAVTGPTDIWKISKLGGWDDLSERVYEDLDITFVARRAKESDVLASTVPVPNVDAIKGLKMRSEGVSAEALTALGASIVFMPSEEIYLALSTGLIDAADATDVSGYWAQGFHEVAKHWVWPPMSAVISFPLVANPDFWNKLSEEDQVLIRNSFILADEVRQHMREYEVGKILAKVQAEHGVTIHYWDKSSVKAWAGALADNFPRFPTDPFWVEGWDLMEAYAEEMGY